MLLLRSSVCLKSLSSFCTAKFDPNFTTLFSISCSRPISRRTSSAAKCFSGISFDSGKYHCHNHYSEAFLCFAISTQSDSEPDPGPRLKPRSKPRKASQNPGAKICRNKEDAADQSFPSILPRKPRRGRKSEADMVEDYVRSSLERTFETIRQENPEVFENKENVLKPRAEDEFHSITSDGDDDESCQHEDGDASDRRGKKMVVEEDDPDWPLDADVGWGIRASEYFEKHPIKNVVGEDGFEIDWEGETDDNWVQEINCLEWESFAFHPSPLVVLVFERYNRATYNWKTLKELEKAIKVYWGSKDRLPPRAVKLDINIERDMAYALKVRDCPQILFLRGNKVLYRERDFRTSDELVQMIAHFYYKAKRPSWINEADICASY